jgi:hypothetical protein
MEAEYVLYSRGEVIERSSGPIGLLQKIRSSSITEKDLEKMTVIIHEKGREEIKANARSWYLKYENI